MTCVFLSLLTHNNIQTNDIKDIVDVSYIQVSIMSSSDDTANTRHFGQVKWFNNKTGYGFITVIGTSEHAGKDIFTHYSAVRVANSQYKYLTQGEYVECMIVKTTNGKHEYQAADITGICGGTLMCEIRNSGGSGSRARPNRAGAPAADQAADSNE